MPCGTLVRRRTSRLISGRTISTHLSAAAARSCRLADEGRPRQGEARKRRSVPAPMQKRIPGPGRTVGDLLYSERRGNWRCWAASGCCERLSLRRPGLPQRANSERSGAYGMIARQAVATRRMHRTEKALSARRRFAAQRASDQIHNGRTVDGKRPRRPCRPARHEYCKKFALPAWHCAREIV